MKHYREDRWSLQARRQGSIVINVCYAQERWKPVFVRMVPNPNGTGCLMQEQFPDQETEAGRRGIPVFDGFNEEDK